jgi:cation diffusion facilitator family transporter
MGNISARRVVVTSLIVDLADITLNLTIAIISGSVVMLSEALQGAADLFTSSMLYIGVRRSDRKPDNRYSFGYGRELYFWTLLAAIAMFTITATVSFWLGLQRVIHPEPLSDVGWAMAVLLLGFCSNSYALYLSLSRLKGGSKRGLLSSLRHSSRIETKATFVLDLMGSSAALFGLISLGVYAITGDGRFDGVGAMIVGAVTAVLAVALVMEAKDDIVGHGASEDIGRTITDATMKVAGVNAVLDLRTMYLGSEKLLVNMEVHLDERMRTKEIEAVIDEIKKRVKRNVPIVKHIQVEVETPSR